MLLIRKIKKKAKRLKIKAFSLKRFLAATKKPDFLMLPAEHLYIGFLPGIEKEVKDSALNFIFDYAKDYSLQKSRTKYRIKIVKEHPYFGDGYALEVQVGGDGFSYLDIILKSFESKIKIINFNLKGEASSTIRKTPGNIESYYLPDITIAGDLKMTSIEGRTIKTIKLFNENYLFFYMARSLMGLGFIAFILALKLRYGPSENERTVYLKTNVEFVNLMPVKNLKSAESTEYVRLRALKYDQNINWHKLEEELDENTNLVTQVIVKIKNDGTEIRTKGVPIAK